MEVSYQGTGRILGVDTIDSGTYVATLRPDGTLYGQGRGLSMGPDGEAATWEGAGVGIPTGGMGATWRGAIYYSTPAEAWQRLNQVAAIYEYEVNPDGTLQATVFEWR